METGDNGLHGQNAINLVDQGNSTDLDTTIIQFHSKIVINVLVKVFQLVTIIIIIMARKLKQKHKLRKSPAMIDIVQVCVLSNCKM